MREIQRPDPDDLLKRIAGEKTGGRGKLKIFFGYAAGVGKTYAMLDAAHTAMKAGVEAVVGYVEPHTRPETLALLDGLEQLPPLKVDYKGITLNEFDLDAALARKPELILVDELAHTNAQGCRHTKRYNDVEELLDAGINVYTTMNVQHLESLNDIVASITQVIVKERVPDCVFDDASQVELVDIEPDELTERLNQGKIYRETQAKRALSNFFIRDNLVALREIALRRTADRVNRTLETSKAGTAGPGYYTGEHIMICLSSSPSNAKVIRTAARMVNAFHAAFTALFVETPATRELSQGNLERLRSNLKLAQQLGAKIATVYGGDVPYQISEYAKASGVSKIVIGRSNNKPSLFRRRQNLVEQLTHLAPNLDVHVIPDNQPPYTGKTRHRMVLPSIRAGDVLKSFATLIACSLAGLLFYYIGFSETNIITLYILGALLVANQTDGKLYGICYSIASVLVFNFLFTDPRFSFQAYGAEYPITFLVMLAASLTTSTLTMRVRDQAKATAQRAWRTDVLLETSQKLQRAAGRDAIITQAASQILQLTSRTVILYPVKGDALDVPRMFHPEGDAGSHGEYIAPEERAVADWVRKNNRPAGQTTDTLPGAKAYYLPVSGSGSVLAVVGIVLGQELMEEFERSLLMGMLGEIAFALEKYQLYGTNPM